MYICSEIPENRKNTYEIYKNNLKIAKQNKTKKNKNFNFKGNINVKAMTSREHQKSCASNL